MSERKKYDKPPLSYQDQIEQLKSRGLSIEDDAKALHLTGPTAIAAATLGAHYRDDSERKYALIFELASFPVSLADAMNRVPTLVRRIK